MLAALTCLLFAPALMDPGSVFFFRDVSQNHHPYRELTTSLIARGELPLWNAWRGAGQPLLANPNALLLHPTTLLFLLLPFEAAFKLAVILQYFVAAAGTWLVLRDMRAGRIAALLGAAAFAFSGYMVSLGNLINLLDSAAFMPLTIWLTGRALTRGFAPWGSLAAMSLAVQVLAGEPAILIVTGLAVAGLHWSIDRGTGEAVRGTGARLAALSGVGLLAAAIAMAGLLPTLELIVRSERAAGFEATESMKWSQPPAALIEMLVPGVFGDPTRIGPGGFRGGSVFDAGLPFILSTYVGPAVLLLAGIGFVRGVRAGGRRRAEAIAMAALAGAGLALSLGRYLPLYPVLIDLFPPLASVRYPVKYCVLAVWAVALLSARGHDASGPEAGAYRPAAWRRAIPAALTGGLAFAGAAAAAAVASGVPGAGGDGPLPILAAPLARGGALVAATALLAALPRSLPVALALFAVPAVDLIVAGVGLNPVAPASFYSRPSLVGPLVEGRGGGRVWAMPRPKGFAFRTPVAEEIDPSSLASGFLWDRLTLRNAACLGQEVRFAYDRGNERLDVMPGAALGRLLYEKTGADLPGEDAARLLALAGVGRVISYGDLRLPGFVEGSRIEGRSNVPIVVLEAVEDPARARVVTDAEVHPGIERALGRLREPSFDPRRTVILEERAVPPPGAGEGDGPAEASVRIVEESASRVVLEARSPAAGHLVLADTYHPGWKATVDGADTPIVRANAMFRAVPIAAGRHDVVFEYDPSSVKSGAMVTAAALLLAALLAVPRRR